MGKYTVAQHITRFFWLPRGTERHQPTSYARLTGIWLASIAVGTAVTAAGGAEEYGGADIMTVIVVLNVIDDIITGVRHRWPAALAAVALLYGGSRLTGAVLSDSLDTDWATTIAAAVGVTLALAATATLTRLPQRPATTAR
ncbi:MULTISPECIES: hypothetical protein [unclassified Streptomyces]|uniref:hypothetical protein n=1 Tax=unclassified Streptomyces TaxID=2593676 RepID=UPI002DD8DA3B|nr:hypothetical protein [Streptomyces sp. NBC_01445]WSE02608.1 hypothetical protein OG574_03975 [Streptomyces sp. NBC_01445]